MLQRWDVLARDLLFDCLHLHHQSRQRLSRAGRAQGRRGPEVHPVGMLGSRLFPPRWPERFYRVGNRSQPGRFVQVEPLPGRFSLNLAFDTITGRLCYTQSGIDYRYPTCYDLYEGKNPRPPGDIFDDVQP